MKYLHLYGINREIKESIHEKIVPFNHRQMRISLNLLKIIAYLHDKKNTNLKKFRFLTIIGEKSAKFDNFL